MDIQHISALIEILSSLGFSTSVSKTLVLNACFRQKEFIVKERMHFGDDTINYQLFFKEDTAIKKLVCTYYDATLRKAVEIPASIINGVDVPNLEKRMGALNWQMVSENNSTDDFKIADKSTWKQEAAIEEIIKELEVLGSTGEWHALANTLKYKYWIDLYLQSMINDLATLKNKYELTQRFYIISGEGITASEAYRFLNNKWMERKIQANNRTLRQNEVEQKERKAIPKGNSNKKRNNHSSKENTGK
jgi:hypothetical protein